MQGGGGGIPGNPWSWVDCGATLVSMLCCLAMRNRLLPQPGGATPVPTPSPSHTHLQLDRNVTNVELGSNNLTGTLPAAFLVLAIVNTSFKWVPRLTPPIPTQSPCRQRVPSDCHCHGSTAAMLFMLATEGVGASLGLAALAPSRAGTPTHFVPRERFVPPLALYHPS